MRLEGPGCACRAALLVGFPVTVDITKADGNLAVWPRPAGSALRRAHDTRSGARRERYVPVVTENDDRRARIRAVLATQDVVVDDDELPLIERLHLLLAASYAPLGSADVARFPHEPIDPSRAPDRS